jgi:hypothetical protein
MSDTVNNQPEDRRAQRWHVWCDAQSTFFSTYEEAWRFSERTFADTGRLAFIEPVYTV